MQVANVCSYKLGQKINYNFCTWLFLHGQLYIGMMCDSYKSTYLEIYCVLLLIAYCHSKL